MQRRMKEFLQASYWSLEQVRYRQGERMVLPRRDRENTRGNHVILTAVDWCFGEGGLAARLGLQENGEILLNSERKKVDNEVVAWRACNCDGGCTTCPLKAGDAGWRLSSHRKR
jgi:hypothetical protein